MSKYTSEDFAKAEVARMPGRPLIVAVRASRSDGRPWMNYSLSGTGISRSDKWMAEHGWVPVLVPDPEPTLEKGSSRWWIENASIVAEDCDTCDEANDLCPVHHGIALGIDFVTKKIAALGDDPELLNSIPDLRDES